MTFPFPALRTALSLLLLFSANSLSAQDGVLRGSFLSLRGGLMLEDEGGPEGRASAPAVGITAGHAFGGRLRVSAMGTLARRSFDVGPDRLHRNLVFLDVGAEYAVDLLFDIGLTFP